MSVRRAILRDLNGRHQAGEAGYIRPVNITGFSAQPSQYQTAINSLLQDRLINGTKDGDGHMAVALNTHRLADIRKELRAWYVRPAAWLVAAVVVAVLIVIATPG